MSAALQLKSKADTCLEGHIQEFTNKRMNLFPRHSCLNYGLIFKKGSKES